MKFTLHPLFSSLLLSTLSPFAAQAITAPVIADVHLAATNAGAAVGVTINPTSKGLLKFDLTTLPDGISSSDIAKATLVFFVKTVTTGGKLQASPVIDSWGESTVTSISAPALGAAAVSTAPISAGNNYFALDVTPLVLNWVDSPASNNGLALEPFNATATALTLDSKESIQTSHSAYIEITLNNTPGPKGDKGDTGLQGVKGDMGLQGSKGDRGETGLQGAKGDKGDKGEKGNKGTFQAGTVAGQILYWDGSAWVAIAPGATGQTLTYCKGVPIWGVCLLTVGDSYQGGKVAYILQAGDPGYDPMVQHGLIAAPSDQGTGAWGCQGANIQGADGTTLGTGRQNTLDITAGCATSGIAARLCADLVLNGYSDWYLPSKDELSKLFANRVAIGNFASSLYWSSSEYHGYATYAWLQSFDDGIQYGSVKNSPHYHFRAVRAF